MSLFAATLGVLLLLPAGSRPVGSAQPAVAVRVSSRTCLIGHPVTLTLQTSQPVGTTIQWNLIDQSLAADTTLVILQISNLPWRNAIAGHQVIFTCMRGGRYESSPLCALLVRGTGIPDTLIAPTVTIRFQPEALRGDLHPLKPVVSMPPTHLLSSAWPLVLATLLLGTAAALWLLFRKVQSPSPQPQEFLPAAQARQQALLAMEEFERNLAAGSCADSFTPDHLYRIVADYLARRHVPEELATPAEYRLPQPPDYDYLPDSYASLRGLLGELRSARFAPVRPGTDGLQALLTRAREFVRAEEVGAVSGNT